MRKLCRYSTAPRCSSSYYLILPYLRIKCLRLMIMTVNPRFHGRFGNWLCYSSRPSTQTIIHEGYSKLQNITVRYKHTRWCSWLRHCNTSWKVAGWIPDGVTRILHSHKSFRLHYGPAADSASNRKENQEYFLGSKGGRCYCWQTYHLHVPLSWHLGASTSWKPQSL